jgi:hypothetical protein
VGYAFFIDAEPYGIRKHEYFLEAEFRTATILEMISMHNLAFGLLSELAHCLTRALQAV